MLVCFTLGSSRSFRPSRLLWNVNRHAEQSLQANKTSLLFVLLFPTLSTFFYRISPYAPVCVMTTRNTRDCASTRQPAERKKIRILYEYSAMVSSYFLLHFTFSFFRRRDFSKLCRQPCSQTSDFDIFVFYIILFSLYFFMPVYFSGSLWFFIENLLLLGSFGNNKVLDNIFVGTRENCYEISHFVVTPTISVLRP